MKYVFDSCVGVKALLPEVDSDSTHTFVGDLRTLREMPLASLNLTNSRVSDLSPLSESELIELKFTPRKITKGLDAIRRMNSIQRIGESVGVIITPAEFWKRYDAGEFGKAPNPQ